MIKQLLSTTLLFASVFVAYAEVLSPEQALARLGDGKAKSRGMEAARMTLAHTTFTDQGEAALFIFNKNDDQGFMILSADDMAEPVLAIADDGEFDLDNIPPAMEWWLGEYARQIEYARQHPAATPAAQQIANAKLANAAQGRESIAPLIKVSWDQGEPYNNNCPLDKTIRTYTGCVATAMAQVMKYWNYPQRGTGTVSYNSESIGKKLSLNFALQSFDWDNMLETYIGGQYNEKQADAVSYLMKACGYSVKMDYGTDSSGALAMNVRQALVKYFKYDGNALYTLREYYPTDEWYEKMYQNLKNVGPVICGGASMLGGGHSFVCDGYDKETNMFHFNWGWTGMSNGYFSLDALNPDALGTGGGNGGGYNFTQDAVFGIQPPTGDPIIPQTPKMTQEGSLVAEIDEAEDCIVFDLDMQQQGMWVNYNPQTMYVQLWASVTRQGSSEPVYTKQALNTNIKVEAGYGFAPVPNDSIKALRTTVDLKDLREKLTDGVYEIRFKTRDYNKEDAELVDILYPYCYYDYITITKVGDKISVKDYPAPSLDIVSAEFTTPVVVGGLAKVKMTVKNPSDIQLSAGLAPLFAYGSDLHYLGESIFVTVDPGAEVTREWLVTMQALNKNALVPSTPTDFHLMVFDETTYLIYMYDSTVKMQPASSFKISVDEALLSTQSNPSVTNATNSTITQVGPSKIKTGIYTIDNPYDIQVSTKYKVTEGYFAYPLYSILGSADSKGNVSILAYSGENVMRESSRLSRTMNATISYSAMKANETYYIMTGYYDAVQGGLIQVSGGNMVCVMYESAGVDNIAVDNSTLTLNYDPATGEVTALSTAGIKTLSAYSIGGALIDSVDGDSSDRASLSIENAAAGLIIIKATDNTGNSKVLKIRN